MNYKIITAMLVLFFVSIYIFSCNDNNMISYSEVSGKIYYDYYPAVNVKVSNGYNVARTSSDGNFHLSNVTFPYNLTVLDSNNGKVSVFKNLSIDKVDLDMGNHYNGFNTGYLRVTIPDTLLRSDIEGKLIFTDGEYVNSYVNIYNYTPTLNVTLPGYMPVTGKIILLSYKINSAGNIVSYENFGVKNDFTVYPGQENQFTFTAEDIAMNPGEEMVSGSVNKPPNYTENFSGFNLSFTDKKFTGDTGAEFFGNANGSPFQFIIPTGISVPFSTIVRKDYHTNDYTSEIFQVYPDSPNVHFINKPVELNTPENHATNVDNSTLFSFSEGSGNGVYEIIIKQYNTSISYRIITTSTSFKLGDIDQSGFGSIMNLGFVWSVRKIGNYDSMNDYAANRLEDVNSFQTYSEQWEFFTHP
jgi:hypothetical protein